MLQYTAVYPATLELLKKIMQEKCLEHFNLVGGTALALQIGHRISVDIDLFSDRNFNSDEIIDTLKNKYNLTIVTTLKNSIICQIEYPNGSNNYIKIDIVKYPYPLIDKIVEIDGIRMLSKKDIIPMKLSAIANRGSKKDFTDIYFLLKEFSIDEMLILFKNKFPDINYFHIIKSLGYFEDAETDINPKMIKQADWDNIKLEILQKIKKYI